jgi:hypothetical protein
MNFSGPIDSSNGNTVSDTMFGTLYRSPRLLSAWIGGWRCCGAHGYPWELTLNLDPRTGREVRLDELVEVEAVATFCWNQFSRLAGPMDDQGKVFVEHYPRTDFETHVRGAGWLAAETGLTLNFGEMLGYVGSTFDCHVELDNLRRFAKSGVSVPL